MSNTVKIKIYEGTGTRKLYARTADGHGGWTSTEDGNEMYGFVVEVDADWFRSMGAIAARNTTGRAKRGGLTAKVVNRRKL